MAKTEQDRFLHYYNQELSYLRHSGKAFARTYPKIARRLEMSDSESPDPHVERLIESFAFLTGRISQEIDDQYPQTATALLNVLYPHLVNPIPAMAIAHLKSDPSRGNLTTGYSIPKGTLLNAQAHEGISCHFSTIYPLTLWPVELTNVSFSTSNKFYVHGEKAKEWFIRFDLKSVGVDFKAMEMDHLDMHIHADRKLALLVYQTIFAQKNIQVYFSTDKKNVHALPKGSLKPLGFEPEEMSLPMGSHTIHSYQLLQEYFHLPEKFLFFRIQNLKEMLKHEDLITEDLQLFISLEDVSAIYEQSITAQTFLLGATPIVNLFPKTTDPFRLDKKQTQYRLIPDQRLDKTTEIYSIEEIVGSVEGQGEPQVLSPYYSFDHHTTLNSDTTYWIHKRTSSSMRDLPGTDIHLSFVDMNFTPQMPAQQIIRARTLCTNRYLPEQLPYNCSLSADISLPVSQITCLDKPVPQMHAPQNGSTLWKLISQLSVNHLGLTSGKASVDGLKEMLRLYIRNSSQSYYEIEMIKDIRVSTVSRRVNKEAWRGFVRGHEVTFIVEESNFTGASTFLLSSVLRYYFGLHVGVNSFIEIVLKNDLASEEIMRWEPIPGMQVSL
jgi:type VI secretion system protein ImpG